MAKAHFVEVKTQKQWNSALLIALISCGFGLIIILVVVGFLAYLPYDQLVNGPKAAAVQKDLEREFKSILPLGGAAELRYGSMNKTHQGDVGSDYKTDKSYDDIRRHYDKELERLGWRFAEEKGTKSWGHDYGGKQAFYCKGVYTATLQYAGREEHDLGWTYSFGLSWGLFDECN